jgi:hydrogenase maturation protease
VPDQQRIIVLGIGNPLVRDEGVGIRIIEELMSSYEWPGNVRLIDAGTMGLGILNLFKECDYMLIVDAVDGTGLEPGTVVRLTPEEIAPNQVRHSLHDTRFVDVLESAELLGYRPEADCVGVQVKELVSVNIGLTPQVEAAVPDAVEAALQILAERGVRPTASSGSSSDARLLESIRTGEPAPDPHE